LFAFYGVEYSYLLGLDYKIRFFFNSLFRRCKFPTTELILIYKWDKTLLVRFVILIPFVN